MSKNGRQFQTDSKTSELDLFSRADVSVESFPENNMDTMSHGFTDLQRLHQVTMRISRIDNLEMALLEILEGALSITGTHLGAISLTDTAGKNLFVKASKGFSEEFIDSIGPVPFGKGAGTVLKRGTRIVVENTEMDPVYEGYRDKARAYGIRSAHSVPLICGDNRIIGVLSAHFTRHHLPTERENQLMDLYGALAADFVERHRNTRSLKESEQRLKQILETVPASIYMCDSMGHITFFNKTAVELWGRQPDMNKDLWCGSTKIFDPDGTPMAPHESPMAQAIRENHPVRNREIILERADGTRRYVLPYPTPIRDDSGHITGALNLLLDITDRKRIEADVDVMRSRLAAIVEWSDDAIVSKDLNGTITSWNRAATRLFGYQPEEVIGKPVRILIPEHAQNEEDSILERVRNGKTVDHYETVRRRKDGKLINISLTVSPVRDTNGNIIGAAKIARDITIRKQVENSISRSYEVLTSVLQAIPDIVFVTDTRGRIQFKNPAAERFFLLARLEGLPPAIQAQLDQVLRTGEELLPRDFKTVHRFVLKNQERFFLSRIVAMTEEDKVFGGVLILQDVTELRLLDEVKTNLIATVSHELKTPITSILTSLAILIEQTFGPLNSKQFELLTITRNESERLLRTLNALLDLTRFEESILGMRTEPVSATDLVHDAMQSTHAAALNAAVGVKMEMEEGLPMFEADRERILHALTNFLTNAIKYSPPGSEVVVRVRRQERGICFSVIDQGPGIPEQYHSRIFEKLFRIPDVRHQGAGLGLWIAREIVHAHGGTIGVHSQLGDGSEFFFILPVKSPVAL